MASLSRQDRESLLRLARSAIEGHLRDGHPPPVPKDISAALAEKRGCFVTLHAEGGALRGCIGTIEPVASLADAVARNAVNAAFRDPRFPPLTSGEFDGIELEISVLTVPEPLAFVDGEELKSRLEPGVHGVILEKGWHRSTFLPQVWEQLPDPERFLAQLCLKAGLGPDCWRKPGVKAKTYKAMYFSEHSLATE
jgi:AmmeMemoRadiSam system protein A